MKYLILLVACALIPSTGIPIDGSEFVVTDSTSEELVRIDGAGKVTLNGDPHDAKFWAKVAKSIESQRQRAESARRARCDDGAIQTSL